MPDSVASTGQLTLRDVRGLRVGHATNDEAVTGCTVVLALEGAVAGVDVRGAAPGTRETDLLQPGSLVKRIHAVCLAGGSAFGLAAADGVMGWLAERGIGFPTEGGPVPIVPAAILYDLSIGRADVRPTAADGAAACDAAERGDDPLEGSVGAGTGATVAKLSGPEQVRMGGVGMAGRRLVDGHVLAAMAVCNACELIDISNNIGDSKSLICHPATTTHHNMGPEGRAEAGIGEGMLRLNVGLEDPLDLIDDRAPALDRAGA